MESNTVAAPSTAPPVTATGCRRDGVGRLGFAISPWGEVYVDGRKRGVTPPMTELKLPPGTYTVEIRNTTFAPHRRRSSSAPTRRSASSTSSGDVKAHRSLDSRMRAADRGRAAPPARPRRTRSPPTPAAGGAAAARRKPAAAATEAQAAAAAAQGSRAAPPPPPARPSRSCAGACSATTTASTRRPPGISSGRWSRGSQVPPTRRTRASISRSWPASRSRTSACRAEFRKAFEADPAFDLTPAEAGHPMWGPVFRSVKAEVAKKRKPAAPNAPATSR